MKTKYRAHRVSGKHGSEGTPWRQTSARKRGRTLEQDGYYRTVTKGISLGCPLSPLMGALYLSPLDETM